ncbi:MAG: hypothetical protein ACR2O4_08825, partial [Hyphomicrobiaceae bacterium]
GELYLVQRDGADHLELLELADLRSARFYGQPRGHQASGASVTALKPSFVPDTPGTGEGTAPRLSDNIRRSVRPGEAERS